MARGKGYTFDWNSPGVMRKVDKAIETASVKWGVTVAQKAKGFAHRLTGTLSRSLHAAPDDYAGDDTGTAMVSVMPLIVGNVPRWVGGVAMVASGSWINYAVFEKGRGGEHDFLSQPVQEANKEFPTWLRGAMAREGLR